MIDDSTIFASIIIACAIVGTAGGILGMVTFFDFRRKRYFVEYMNRKMGSSLSRRIQDGLKRKVKL